MIIQLDAYRTAQADFPNGLDYRDVCGNTVRQPKYDARRVPSPMLPDQFDDFNAKDFIDRAYGLATQI